MGGTCLGASLVALDPGVGPLSRAPQRGCAMTNTDQLRGGELNAALTSALVGIHTAHLGRGPKAASTFHHGNVVVTLMHDVMTPAERTLARTGNAPAVTNMRHLFQETMQAEFSDVVERMTGRAVVAFISGNHVEPDMAAEVFVLDDVL
jgi:uncharacterized protein YbcI